MIVRLLIVPLFVVMAGAATTPAPNKLTLNGTLKTGVAAVGGETTGVELSSGGTTYELEIKDADVRKKADELNGKSVTVTGTLTIKQGTTKGQRLIVTVDSLTAAPAATKP